MVAAINSQASNTGVTASLGSDGQTLTLNAADGANILVTQSATVAGLTGGLAGSGASAGLTNVSGVSSSTSGQLYGNVTLASASSVQLSGAAAVDIASQSVNSTNSADSLQATQTINSTTAVNGGTNGGTINFYVGNTATPVSIAEGTTTTATQIAQEHQQQRATATGRCPRQPECAR